MLSKNKIKLIRSLDEKKVRNKLHLFLAEGHKVVNDCLPYFHCNTLIATPEWLHTHSNIQADEIIEANNEEIYRASLLMSPQDVLAVFEQSQDRSIQLEEIQNELILALDKVQDPGNMGTILRIADWFGIEKILCTPDTVDIYNPKVVQASMGAISRVKVYPLDLSYVFEQISGKIPIYGTFLNGENMYKKTLSDKGILLMGNEGNGISKELEKWVTERLYIPNYPIGRATSESLNVAIATAVVCAEFRRKSTD